MTSPTKIIHLTDSHLFADKTAALRKIPGSDNMIEQAITNNPHKRLTQPEDIGNIIALFADYESSWMTGNVIKVDGGEGITG